MFILNSLPEHFIERDAKFHHRFNTIWEEKFKSIVEMSSFRITNSFLQNNMNSDSTDKFKDIIKFIRQEIQKNQNSRQQNDVESVDSCNMTTENAKEHPNCVSDVEVDAASETKETLQPELIIQMKDVTISEEKTAEVQGEPLEVSLIINVEDSTFTTAVKIDDGSLTKCNTTTVENILTVQIQSEEDTDHSDLEFMSLVDLPQIFQKLFEKSVLPKFIEESIRLRDEIIDTLSEF
jgi:hypothetical protein